MALAIRQHMASLSERHRRATFGPRVQIPIGLRDDFESRNARLAQWGSFEEFVRESVRRRLDRMAHDLAAYERD
jgi:hypothetical protein